MAEWEQGHLAEDSLGCSEVFHSWPFVNRWIVSYRNYNYSQQEGHRNHSDLYTCKACLGTGRSLSVGNEPRYIVQHLPNFFICLSSKCLLL